MKHHRTHCGDITFELNPTFYTSLATSFQMLPEGAKSILAVFKLFLDFILSTLSLPLEALLLNRYGTRALSLFQLIQVSGLAALAVMLRDPLLSLFLLTGVGFGWWRFIEARRHEWTRKPYRHSYVPGEPVVWSVIARFLVGRGLPRWLFAEPFVFRFWEPATGLIAGLLFLALPFTRFLGMVLIVIGIAFFTKRHVMYLRQVTLWRDKADAECVGRAMTAEEEGPEIVHLVRLAVSPEPSESIVPTKPGKKPPTPEKIRTECVACGSWIRCPVSKAGATLPCPNCHADVLIPAA